MCVYVCVSWEEGGCLSIPSPHTEEMISALEDSLACRRWGRGSSRDLGEGVVCEAKGLWLQPLPPAHPPILSNPSWLAGDPRGGGDPGPKT